MLYYESFALTCFKFWNMKSACTLKENYMDIDELGLSTRTHNSLKRRGIVCVEDLVEIMNDGGYELLLSIYGLGTKGASEILQALKDRNLLTPENMASIPFDAEIDFVGDDYWTLRRREKWLLEQLKAVQGKILARGGNLDVSVVQKTLQADKLRRIW